MTGQTSEREHLARPGSDRVCFNTRGAAAGWGLPRQDGHRKVN